MNRVSLSTLLVTMMVLATDRVLAQDSVAMQIVSKPGSITSIKDPTSSTPGAILQSLKGLGFLDPGPSFLKETASFPSTLEHLTEEWPPTRGVMPKGWISRGVLTFYRPPVEEVRMQVREAHPAVFIGPGYDFWFPIQPEIQQITRPEPQSAVLERPVFQEPEFDYPRFATPQFQVAARHELIQRIIFETAGDGMAYGGIFHQRDFKGVPNGLLDAPQRRFQAAQFWDAKQSSNDPRDVNEPSYYVEEVQTTKRRIFINRENLDPENTAAPGDPKPSFNIRDHYFPHFPYERSAGGR